MTLIKATPKYTISSEQSERKETSGIPDLLLMIGVVFAMLCLIGMMTDLHRIGIVLFMAIALLFFCIGAYTKPGAIKTIPTLKITLSELPIEIREKNGSFIPVKAVGIFSTWREIDVTKDVDELSRRMQEAIDSVTARYEEEKTFQKIEAKRNEDHKSCIADLEKQALEKLK